MKIREAGTFSLLLIALAGCATRGQVRDQVSELEAKRANLERLEQRLDSLTEAIDREAQLLSRREERVAATRAQALLAADNARAAEQTTAGGLLGETVYWLQGLPFEADSAELTDRSRALLDQLAERLKMEDAGYYLEVRAGSGQPGGRALDLARAQAVRRYLHVARGLPLHAVRTLAAPGAADRSTSASALVVAPASASEAAVGEAPPAEQDTAALSVEPAAGSRMAVVVVRPFTRH
ncbi:MAG TPA: hypothetical protein VMS86_02365 [Thermoanaerobaculia bacterium]|nr:hypothetical protein [Thermoanaerobaculia bacterium]